MQVALAKLAPTIFEQFASERGHDIAPAVLPAPDRVYADRQTQELFETWNAGAATLARTLMESTFESPPCELVRNRREAPDGFEAAGGGGVG
jgi:site-specific recombinase